MDPDDSPAMKQWWVKNSPTRVNKSWTPVREFGKAELISGADAAETADKLYVKLKELGFVK